MSQRFEADRAKQLLEEVVEPKLDGVDEKIDDIEEKLDNLVFGLARLDEELEDIQEAIAVFHDVVFYPVAEDMGTTKIIDDGSSPALTDEVSKTNANEVAGEADPSWSEDINFEHRGIITVVSIFYELRWQMKLTGAGTAYVKWQISGDGGATWVDITDNITETDTNYVNKIRIGVGKHIPIITAGSDQLQLRVCAWTDATSVEIKVRCDCNIRLTYVKE